MSDHHHHQSISILIVEDNPGDLFLLEELLYSSALPIRELFKATSAAEAVAILQKEVVNLVLLDLTLPDSSGLQSYMQINQYAVSVPIIVLTGLIDMEVALETMASGAQDYLIKGEFDEKLLNKSIQYSIERKKSLENLRESNERYEFVTKATNDVVWDMNLLTHTIYWAGDNMSKLFGYELKDAVSDFAFWENCLHLEDRKRVITKLELTLTDPSKALWGDEYRFRRKDGSYAHVVDKGYLIYQNGRSVRMIGSMQDITDRKQAEIQVKNSEQRFRSLVQNGSDMIMILDENGDFTFSSPTVEKVLGYTSGMLLDKNKVEFLHPDERDSVMKQFQMIKQRDYHEIPYFRFKDLQGEWRWLETKLTNLMNDASVNGIVSNSRDVTEKKKVEEAIKASEERYRNLFYNNPMTIFIWDIETLEFLEVNETAQKEYGYSRAEFLSMTVADIRPQEDNSKLKKFAQELAGSAETKMMGVWHHLKKNGESIFMEISSHKLVFKDRPSVLAIANNITEKIRLEKKLQEERAIKQKEITEAVIRVQEKERYEISRELHDNVNQQLTVAMMYLATAEKSSENHPALLKQSSAFIFNAIEEIRKLSKALVTPLIKDFGLSKAIDGLTEDVLATNTMHIDFFSESFYEEDINYEFKLNIFRIVQEQMNNIIKHANATQIIIELYRDEQVKLSIIDNGIGFDLNQKRKGIGLNNIISRTELYNGRIDIQTTPGNGCRLIIEFPLTDDILVSSPTWPPV